MGAGSFHCPQCGRFCALIRRWHYYCTTCEMMVGAKEEVLRKNREASCPSTTDRKHKRVTTREAHTCSRWRAVLDFTKCQHCLAWFEVEFVAPVEDSWPT